MELRLVVDDVRDLRGVPATLRLEADPERLVLEAATATGILDAEVVLVMLRDLEETEMVRVPVPLTVSVEDLTGAEAFLREDERWTPED